MENIPMYQISYERTIGGEIVLSMAEVLGGAIGFWLIYALLALAFKHKASWIITLILSIASGVAQISVFGDFLTLTSAIVAIFFIYFTDPLQIRSEKKERNSKR